MINNYYQVGCAVPTDWCSHLLCAYNSLLSNPPLPRADAHPIPVGSSCQIAVRHRLMQVFRPGPFPVVVVPPPPPPGGPRDDLEDQVHPPPSPILLRVQHRGLVISATHLAAYLQPPCLSKDVLSC
jgi:hypothetical protein